MITKERIKAEIDNIKDEHLTVLYRIIKALEAPIEEPVKTIRVSKSKQADNKSEWHNFIQETYGCLADSPIKRGNQERYEVREEIE